MTDNRVRIKKYILEKFGKETLEEILSGKKIIVLNDKSVPIDDKFPDKRISPTTKVEIHEKKPEPKAVDIKTAIKVLDKEAPAEVHVSTHVPLSEKLNESVTPESKEPKIMRIKDFLTTEQIVAIKSGKANVFVNGSAVKDIETEITANESGEPTIDDKIAVVKVLPKMHGG